MVSLFFPEFSVDEANRKFSEILPFKKGFLGAITGIGSAFVITIFCNAGIGTYFEQPKRIEIINMTIEEAFEHTKDELTGKDLVITSIADAETLCDKFSNLELN